MKKYNKTAILLILILAVIGMQLYAQPVLTQSNNAPVVGDSFVLNYIDVSSINEGASGANVTWDFSNLSSIGIINKTWVDPTSTPNDTFFTEANLAYYDTINGMWKYYQSTTSEIQYIGNLLNQYLNKGTDYVKTMGYPFSYNNSYFDAYLTHNINQHPEDSLLGNISVSGDAYGTLILPHCTVSNVLRIKVQIDETFYWQSTTSILNYHGEEYLWFIEGVHEPVFFISKSLTNGTYNKAYYLENIPNGIAEYGEDTGFYPNPASEYIVIKGGQNLDGETQVEISGINGKTYIQTTIDNNSRVDVSGLSPGIYFLKFKSKSSKLIIQN